MLTESTTSLLGQKAPDFKLLLDVVSNKEVSFVDLQGKEGTCVLFICNHCPYVKHVITQIVAVAKEYQAKGIGFIAISSNDIEKYPDDSPENMAMVAKDYDFTFPYLYDYSQEVAKVFDAACTPDIYLLDHSGVCVYHGRFDGATPGNNKPVTGADLRAAMDGLLAGNEPLLDQKLSVGCNIKWK